MTEAQGSVLRSAIASRMNIVISGAVCLHTDTVDMTRLLKSTMRLRPTAGEVRDGAAMTLLKALNTGHPGGATTIHSNTPMSALRRLEQLTAEASQQPVQEVIDEAVDLVVSFERTSKGRRVRAVIHVEGFGNARYGPNITPR
ncbi:Flp pilus assembly CpaF family ATPase [Sinorhizobium medicae]